MAAAAVILMGVILAAGGGLATMTWLRAAQRRQRQRMWDDFVARHQELDRELNQLWLH
jgi:hypothetical protein